MLEIIVAEVRRRRTAAERKPEARPTPVKPPSATPGELSASTYPDPIQQLAAG
jgi:hypothetical protein